MPRTSDKAEKILDYVNQFIQENGYSPSVREIGAAVKESTCNGRDLGLVPGLGPGEGLGIPFQYACLENPTDREAWEAIVHGVAKNRTRLSD